MAWLRTSPAWPRSKQAGLGDITVNLEPMEAGTRGPHETSSFRDWRPLGLSLTALSVLLFGFALALGLILRGRARSANPHNPYSPPTPFVI